MPDLPKAYTPSDVEGAIYERWLAADVFAPDGAWLDGRSRPAAVHDHPAAAEHHRVAPPRPRPADRGRGPDDPARPDARSSGAVPARPRPCLDRRPVRARRDPREGGGEPPVAGARALPRADAGVRRDHARGDAGAAASGRCLGRLGPPALHDGRGLGQGRPRRLPTALRGGPRVPHRGARQLVSGLPDERQRPRGRGHAGDRHAVDRSLPPRRRGHRPARPGCHDRRSPPRDPRRSSATPRSPSIRTTSATPASSAASCASRSSTGMCRSSPTTWSTAPSGRAPSRSRRPTMPTTGRPGSDTTCRRSRSWPTTRRSRPPARATTAWTATSRARRSSRISRRAVTSCRRPRTRWSSASASAAATSSSRGSRPSGSCGPHRWPPVRWRRPVLAGRGSCPSGSRRPGSTG